MKSNNWTTEEFEFLRANYLQMSHKELAANLPHRTLAAVKTKLLINGFTKPTFRWTKKTIEDLKLHYVETNSNDLARRYGCSVAAVYNKAAELGLKKSKEWIAQNARENLIKNPVHGARFTQFRKGQKSWNKGTKGLTCANRTSFKKGHRPHNAVPVGTEVFIHGYWKIKTGEPNCWKLKQRLIWEQNFGVIPNSHAVIFKDGNSSNFALENLELISRKELRLRNSFHYQYTPELRDDIRTLAGLKRRITTIKRRKENAKESNG